MSLLTKFIKYIGHNRCLPDWQWTVRTSVTDQSSYLPANEKRVADDEFRILRIKPRKSSKGQSGRESRVTQHRSFVDTKYSENFDWTNVWVGPKTFDPYMVPLPLKQGYVMNREPPGKYGNAELMKIPNFLHLTPPAIKKHCDALQQFCTQWPKILDTNKAMEQHFPITIIASDYCHSSPSIRDPLSRIITLEVNIDSLKLDKHARDKFLRLVGNRYDPKTGNVSLIVKNCPLKKQNYDYAMYILTALCFESWRFEEWEKLKTVDDLEEYCFNLRITKSNLEAYFDYTGQTHPSFEKVAELLEKYVSDKEESNVINSLKQEVTKLLNLPKFNEHE